MRKCGASVLLTIGLLFALSSCGFKDIDNRFFIMAVGIDEGRHHKYEVSLMLAVPSPKPETGESKSQVISQEADTIAEAVRRMKSVVDKEFDFGHAKVFVIGKSFIHHPDLLPSLNWIFRRRDIQQIAYMALGEPDAKTVISTRPHSERHPGNSLLLAMSGDGTESPYIVTETVFDFYRRNNAKGEDAYLPIVHASDRSLVVNRVAVLGRGSRRLELSPEETETFNQLVRGYSLFIIKAPVEGQTVTFSVSKLNIRRRFARPLSDTSEISFKVYAEADVEDSPQHLYRTNWSTLRQAVEEQLQTRYTELLRKLQKHRLDPLGLGLHYRAIAHRGNDEFETWKKLYPDIAFHVRARVKIRSTGIIE